LKTLCYLFLLFLFLSQINLFGSDVPDDFPGMTTTVLSQIGGVYLPSTGVIKALVIFIQFPDDDYVGNSAWPLNSFPLYPFGDGYLSEDVDYTGSSYRIAGISHYFYEMSSGMFHVVGDVYPQLVYTPHTQAYYETNNYHYGEITREVLQSLDPYIDYSEYDNWTTSSSTYSWDSGPDGKVDMIFIRYRWIDENINTKFGLYNKGIANLSYSPISNLVTNDGDTIVMTGFPQSGVTNQFGAYCTNTTSSWSLTWSVGLDAHEFGHYLFGAWHGGPYGGNGLMKAPPGWIGDVGMHSYERERLGWMNFIDISSNSAVSISDYLTNDVAYRVQVPGGTADEYFIVENRQQISVYDRPKSKGIVISHVKGNYTNNIDIECADGRWDWALCEGSSTPTYQGDDRIFKDTENPNSGYDGLDYVWLGSYKYTTDVNWLCYGESVEIHGDADDTYSLEGNYLFAPYTNPNSDTKTGDFTNFSVDILDEENGTYFVYFDFDTDPQTPQNFNGTWYDNHPKIYWTANTEPDFKEYQIWKKRDSGSWNLKLTTTSTYYIDYSEHKWTKPQTPSTIYYKICAVDNTNQTSEFTSQKIFTVNAPQRGKGKNSKIAKSIDPIPLEYKLHPAFPNPFNLTTTLKLDLPEKTTFSLIIYNIRGSEVWSLNNRQTNSFPAGYHTIVWNGTDNKGSVLPTGLYVIVFKSPEYKMIQKLVVVK